MDTQTPTSADAADPTSAQDALEPASGLVDLPEGLAIIAPAGANEAVAHMPTFTSEAAAELSASLPDELAPPPALAHWSPLLLKLVGVGGAGVNIVSRLSAEPLEGLSLAVMDCDARKLGESPVAEKWLLGEGQRRGLSTGGELELGRQAAEASREKLASAGGAADLLFLVAGLGGGTGSAAAPLVAAEASKAGGLVIGFALKPFSFEGGRRAKQADEALVALRRTCDAVIVLPNDLLLQETGEGTSALAAFEMADEWIARAVRSLWRLLCKTGLMNVDFAALQRAFEYRGSKTVFGLGVGERRTEAQPLSLDAGPPTPDVLGDEILASLRACPLMHAPETARRADRLLVSVSGGPSVLTLSLVNRLVQAVTEQFGRGAELIVGATLDEAMGERVELCLIGASDIGQTSKRLSSVSSANNKTVSDRARATQEARSSPSPQSGGRLEKGRGDVSGSLTSRSEVEGDASQESRASMIARGGTAPLPKAGESNLRAAKLPRGKLAAVTDRQGEFGFSAEAERGYFRDTEATLFDGQDLDPPTYLRKGVKIAVS